MLVHPLLLAAFCLLLPLSERLSSAEPTSVSEPGFFRVDEVNDEWVLLDPEGRPFFFRGVNHYGDGSGMPWNLAARYGSREAWRTSVRDRMRQWGFNALAPSIGPTAIDPTTVPEPHGRHNLITRTPPWKPEQFAALDYPFTVLLGYPKQYMSGADLPDVFSDEFAAEVDSRWKIICTTLKDNRNLVGYHYCHNPPWHPRTDSFDKWIDNITRPGTAGRKEWVALMRRIYGTVERWRSVYGIPIETWSDIETLTQPLRGYVDRRTHLADREAFMARVCERWHRLHHDAIRKYDQNHLILGDRNTLHLQPLPEYAIRIMSRYVDVLSVNIMGPPEIGYRVLEDVTRVWDGPLLLADTGAGIYSGEPPKSTFQAATLAEYESVYSGLLRMGAEHPQVIGVGWCGYYETPHPGGRSGLVDVKTDDPLPARIDVVQRWNAWIETQGRWRREPDE